jgi:hypothetical protein
MKKQTSTGGRSAILRSTDILNRETVAEKLGITERSASNLLQRWANEGIVHRTSPGCYMSAFVQHDHDRLILQSLVKRVGHNILLVGASSLKRVGWCTSDVLHVAIPLRPSRPVPRVRNTVIYPVGAKVWLQLAKHSLQMDLDKPPILHPVSQMLWWMDKDSPIEMPSPDRIRWSVINGEPQVSEAMQQHWQGQLDKDLNVELFYRMLHMDRLNGDIPGKSEPFESDDESDDVRAGNSC